MQIITLVAQAANFFSDADVAEICKTLAHEGEAPARWHWLQQGKALDLYMHQQGDEAAHWLRQRLGNAPVDLIIQSDVYRKKRLLLADMESTLIEQEMLDELSTALGLGPQIAAITARAMNGEIDFRTALLQRIELLAGAPALLLQDISSRMSFSAGAIPLVATMRAHGAQCWIVSGGFNYFIQQIADRLGCERCFGNDLLIADDKLVGQVAEPILGRETKKAILLRASEELKLPLHEISTVGDGANDIPMLETCQNAGGLAIAYQPKPAVAKVIANQIKFTDLTTLLFAQGYRQTDFVQA